jgi:hypothetical protein
MLRILRRGEIRGECLNFFDNLTRNKNRLNYDSKLLNIVREIVIFVKKSYDTKNK